VPKPFKLNALWLKLSRAMDLRRLGLRDRSQEAIGVYDQVVERFGGREEPALAEHVAKALVNKGIVLGKEGRSQEAIGVYDQVVERFGEREEPALAEHVAKALVNKGVVLVCLGRDADAVAACEQMEQRFGDDKTPVVREEVKESFDNKCFALSRLWRSTGKQSFLDQAIFAGRAYVGMGGEAYNLACVLVLDGKLDEAFQLLEKCLRDGEVQWAKVEEDSDWADVRNDPRYSELEIKNGGTS